MAKNIKKTEILELKGFLSFLILHELNTEHLCGEDLAIRIGRRKGSVLTPGTIYPALKKLYKMKLIKFKRDGRKKRYELSDSGKVELGSLYKKFSNYFYGLKQHIKRGHYEAVPRGKKTFY